MSKRAILIVLDSVGIGALPDAAEFDDLGADTLGHIQERHPLHIPTCANWASAISRAAPCPSGTALWRAPTASAGR